MQDTQVNYLGGQEKLSELTTFRCVDSRPKALKYLE